MGAGRDHAEDRRHAVHGEEHVGALHHEEYEKQRRGQQFPVLADEEPVAGRLLGDRDEPPKEADQGIFTGLMVTAAEGQFDACVDQEAAEHPENPLVAFDEFRPEEHEREPHDHGAEDAPEEHAILILERDAEVGEYHREHEDVVHRQRPFDEVAREKLERWLGPEPPPDQTVEGQGQRRPEAGPEGALAE